MTDKLFVCISPKSNHWFSKKIGLRRYIKCININNSRKKRLFLESLTFIFLQDFFLNLQRGGWPTGGEHGPLVAGLHHVVRRRPGKCNTWARKTAHQGSHIKTAHSGFPHFAGHCRGVHIRGADPLPPLRLRTLHHLPPRRHRQVHKLTKLQKVKIIQLQDDIFTPEWEHAT